MASPSFVVNLAEILRKPGAQHPLVLHAPIPGVALTSSRIPDGAPVELDATVEAQGRTVIVQGTVRAPWVGECRRCLEEARGELVVELREVFEPDPVEGETFPIEGEQIDLGAVLREVLALALPLAPLCRDDCGGPDPESHPVLPEDAEAHDTAPTDPRWGPLDQLRFDS